MIATRRNDRTIEPDRHQLVRNRNTFTVAAVHRRGDIASVGESAMVVLPPGYVAEHVEFAEAVTAMGAQ